MTWYVVLIAAVGVERLAELVISKRNAAWSFAHGGREFGFSHYPAMVVLHTGLLVGCLVEPIVADRPFIPALGWPMLAIVLASQALRWWCIATLGRQWNTRVIVVPGLSAVHGGPYRWMRHPNYVAVVLEGFALPLVHTAWVTALVFTVLNAFLLRVRIRVENDALRQLDGWDPAPGSRTMIDLLVVGGGPVGLATALYAHRAGLSVVVIERRAGVIDKACGEGLMPGAVAALRELDIELVGREFKGIRYAAPSSSVDAFFPAGPGLGVRRTDLHAALAAAVADAGIQTRLATVEAVHQTEQYVEAAGVRARYLAAADGLLSPVRHLVGLDRPVAGPGRHGLRAHFEVAPWTDLVEVHWARDMEAYVTPIGEGLVGVAILTDRRAPYDELLAGFPELVVKLPRSQATPTRGAGPLRQRAKARRRGRVLLVGDAAGYVDALTGEGISVGLAAARALVDCVRVDEPERYDRAWLHASRRYRWITNSLLFARQRGPVGTLIVPAATRLPRVFGAAVNQLTH